MQWQEERVLNPKFELTFVTNLTLLLLVVPLFVPTLGNPSIFIPPPPKKKHLIIYFLKRKSTFFFIIYPYDPLYILVQHSTTFDSRCCAVSLQFTANLQYNFPLGEVSAQRSNSQSSVCSAHISDDSTHVSY